MCLPYLTELPDKTAAIAPALGREASRSASSFVRVTIPDRWFSNLSLTVRSAFDKEKDTVRTLIEL